MKRTCKSALRPKQAVDILQKLKTIQPKDIGILSRYIEAYVEIGQEEDLVNDYLLLAELLTQAKQMDAALKIYRHLQELSPENSQVRARVQAAESSPTKRAQTQAKPIPTVLTPHPGAVAKGMNAAVPQTPPPAPEPAETSGPQLEKEIRKYENILKLNPENPAVRAQLAERIARTGRMKEADEHWAQAANDFMNRGDFDRCIQIYEDLVSRHPDEARLRERLSRAILKRESLNAIGSIGAEGPITGAGR
ncbi:tetratricopeptide repeat protein [Candidatus Sumerlaeota bacterium]|nr:tetratricopeptide repeat protein [Candidatus Sumerlaeota bacterium]